MRLFYRTIRPAPGSRLLDVGGTAEIWSNSGAELDVTLFNLHSAAAIRSDSDRGRFQFIEGDICRENGLTATYDLVFSNSVLEHVGSARRQRQFALAVTRARAYWVQVPSPFFPIEAHCLVPFWWLLAPAIRRRWIRRWRRRGRTFIARQMAGTRPISRRRLKALFPDGTILTERWLGFPKSYYVFKAG